MALIKQTQNLLKLFENQELCDTTFIVGEDQKEIKTHRLLIATISPVFKAMLFGNMRESEINSEIEIIDVDSNAFESVVKYAYCCQPIFTVNNVISIKQICDKYQISLLSELCDDYFNSCISTQNICILLNQSLNAKLSSYVNIIQQKLSQIGIETSEIITSNGFLQMNETAIKIFLQSDNINIKEEHLWETVLKWADYQIVNATNINTYNDFDGAEPANKRQKLNNGSSKKKKSKNTKKNKNKNDVQIDPKLMLLKSICPYIRFGLMDGKYFVKKIKPLNILSAQDIADILCFVQCNDERCGRFSITPRTYKPRKEIQIPYSLNISAPYIAIGVPNNYATLINSNLKQGCGAKCSTNPWIKATFRNVFHITKIEIAAASKAMVGYWGATYLNGAVLQYKDKKGKWVTVMKDGEQYIKVREDMIQSINVSVETNAIRVLRIGKKCHLGIGCWRIFGFAKQ